MDRLNALFPLIVKPNSKARCENLHQITYLKALAARLRFGFFGMSGEEALESYHVNNISKLLDHMALYVRNRFGSCDTNCLLS